MNRRIGVIAEDRTDGDVVRIVIQRIGGDQISVPIRAQKGCSKIRAKAARIIGDLAKIDVTEIVIIHDLDRNPVTGQLNDEDTLRRTLMENSETGRNRIRRLICIPIEELEAWFWSDPNVVRLVGRSKGDAHPNPHKIARPKEALMRLSRGANSKPRYSTQVNPTLASVLDVKLCEERCRSFKDLVSFVRNATP